MAPTTVKPTQQACFDRWIQRLSKYIERTGKVPRASLTQNLTCEIEEKQISGWLSRQQQMHRGGLLPKTWAAALRSCTGMEERFRQWEYSLPIDSALEAPDFQKEVLKLAEQLTSEVESLRLAARAMESRGARKETESATMASSAAKIRLSASRIEEIISCQGSKRSRVGKCPSWATDKLLQNLRRLQYPMQKRLNVATSSDRAALPRGVTLGLRWDYRNNCGIGRYLFKNDRMTNLCKLLLNFVSMFAPDFQFTSIQVNRSFRCQLHVDKRNLGESLIICIGEFTGGEVYVHGVGKLDAKGKFVQFDGNVPHCTVPFTGERYSVVFYSCSGYESAKLADRQKLRELGFPLPDDGKTSKQYDLSPQERVQEAITSLPSDLACCIRATGGDNEGDDSDQDVDAAGDEAANEIEAETSESKGDAVFKQLLEKQEIIDLEGYTAQEADTEDVMDRILQMSLEEYNVTQTQETDENMQLERAMQMSAMESVPMVAPVAPARPQERSSIELAPSVAPAAPAFDPIVVKRLCEMAHCGEARAKQALAQEGGDAEAAAMVLLEPETLE